MKKRKFLFLTINLFAAAGLAFSVNMDWLGGEMPRLTVLSNILPFELPSQIIELYLSVATPILIGAVLVGVGGLFSMRSMVATGLLINLMMAGFWIWHFGFGIDNLGISDGFSLLSVSFIVSFLSLILHRHQKNHGRKKYGRY